MHKQTLVILIALLGAFIGLAYATSTADYVVGGDSGEIVSLQSDPATKNPHQLDLVTG